MNTYRSPHYTLFALFATLILLLSGCQAPVGAKVPQTTQPPTEPTATQAAVATQIPIVPTPTTSGLTGEISLDTSLAAQGVTIESMPAVPSGADVSWTDATPEYRRLTLQGYPVGDNKIDPQIFVYPVDEMASFNESMAKQAADLQTVLQTRQIGPTLPFLPLYNELQALNAQVQPLDFVNGKGIRYLTQFNQGPVPVNNSQLVYTFQGLTNDGKYYVSAVLPVTNPLLPVSSEVTADFAQKLSDNPGYYAEYIATTAGGLNQQAASSFTPNLDNLDAMLRTLTVPPAAATTPTEPPAASTGDITLDFSAIAQNVSVETVPAVPFDPYEFWTNIGPEYRLLTLEGYPVGDNKIKPQIFVYPVDAMASANETMANIAAELQSLLQTQQAGYKLPFLPLVNEIEAMTVQVKYLDFKSGTGVRYLTQLNQGPVPINNSQLIYTFQGLTSDGKSYVAALLPVTHPELQAGPEFSAEYSQALTNDPGYYKEYITSTINMLNQSSAAGFTPSLDELDGMMRSLTVPATVEATPTPEVFMPAPIEGVLADKARDDLSARLGVDVTSISVEQTSPQTWPDSCLGLPPADAQECTKSEVPGWRLVLNAAGHTHEYRANADGSLLAYSGPVTVAGPDECKINGTSMIYSPEDGYCFAYPVSYHRADEHAPIAIYGPSYGPGPKPVFSSLTLEISSLPEGATLDSVVNDFIASLGNAPAPQTRLTQLIDGETASMVEVVPGNPGSRELFVIHDGKLFQFSFWPAPSESAETAADVNDLYRSVVQSFHFQG